MQFVYILLNGAMTDRWIDKWMNKTDSLMKEYAHQSLGVHVMDR